MQVGIGSLVLDFSRKTRIAMNRAQMHEILLGSPIRSTSFQDPQCRPLVCENIERVQKIGIARHWRILQHCVICSEVDLGLLDVRVFCEWVYCQGEWNDVEKGDVQRRRRRRGPRIGMTSECRKQGLLTKPNREGMLWWMRRGVRERRQ